MRKHFKNWSILATIIGGTAGSFLGTQETSAHFSLLGDDSVVSKVSHRMTEINDTSQMRAFKQLKAIGDAEDGKTGNTTALSSESTAFTKLGTLRKGLEEQDTKQQARSSIVEDQDQEEDQDQASAIKTIEPEELDQDERPGFVRRMWNKAVAWWDESGTTTIRRAIMIGQLILIIVIIVGALA